MATSFLEAFSRVLSGTLDVESKAILQQTWSQQREAFQLLSSLLTQEDPSWPHPLGIAQKRVATRSVDFTLKEYEKRLLILENLFSHPEGCLIPAETYIELLEEGERIFASEAMYEKARSLGDRAMKVRRQLLSSRDLELQRRAEALLHTYIQTDLLYLAA
ncbi:MAG TPA: hypothetical protein PLN21_02395 [Gemmatales bacterium]|nr:hypothetical protein [Gemmatales bacterium]